ncbi:hypothetical protein OE88DRAFT_1724127 [Heliocybe sulcata]|uniref:Uncharacterized protein n=1 Tax=Heliocybe sulcata TaxID=5364 RepID=A0A5C3NCD5_9AGAM|nr:hypothetical protein OE88DRAFT_1724127 [Heliocybe sulcata]
MFWYEGNLVLVAEKEAQAAWNDAFNRATLADGVICPSFSIVHGGVNSMDGPSAAPRLRVTRTPAAMSNKAQPQAGPSRHPTAPFVDLTEEREKVDEGEDTQSTPRIPPSSSLQAAHSNNYDNPAARLRALLARTSNSSNNNTPVAQPPSSSERESDFDSDFGTPSVARESLKELFSRVLQDSSDTPKSRRRNSIDSSITDTPRLALSELDRSKAKRKSESFSDEEVDRLSKYRQSESSAKSNSAATFDSLRAKLDRFRHATRHPDAASDASDAAGYSTEDTASLLRELHGPPVATSTPFSVRMPSHMQLHSNLMDTNSEMQRALNNAEAYTTESEQSDRPPPPPGKEATPPRKPGSRLPRFVSPSQDGTAKKGANLRAQERSRTPTRLSTGPSPAGRPVDREQQLNRRYSTIPASTRPVSWAAGDNSLSSPVSSGPSPQSSLKKTKSTASPNQRSPAAMHNISRRGSSASVLSSDGSPSQSRSRKESATARNADARASVIGLMGVRERRISSAKENPTDLERGWNKPRPRLSSANLRMHQSSPSSSSSRIRTQSIPARPDSAQSMISSQSSTSQIPGITSMSPNARRTSSINSSGVGSSAGDVEPEEEEEEEKEVLIERERNWNSPHPKWELSRGSLSPVPPEVSISPEASPPPMHKRFSLNFRKRTESLQKKLTKDEEKEEGPVPVKTTPAKKPPLRSAASMSGLSPTGRASISPSSPNMHAKSGSMSPSYLGLDSKRASGSHILTPKSPIASPSSRAKSNPELAKAGDRPTKLPAFKGSTAFQFPARNLPPLPPLELDEDSQEESHDAPGVRNSERSDEAEESGEAFHSAEASGKLSPERRIGHRRSFTELVGAAGRARAMPFPADRSDEVLTSDEESVQATSTPTIRTAVLPDSDGNSDPSQVSIGEPVTPPATPPGGEPLLSLATPPRPLVFTPHRRDNGTPSPSKGIPELPGPPSSSEDDTGGARDFTPEQPWNGGDITNFSMMKTPRPPGAWAPTPVVPRPATARAQSMPNVAEGDETEPDRSENATPVPLSRSATLPLQTPAPPGAWMNTPATATRPKGILKVRFDMEGTTSESDLSHMGNGNGIPAPQFKVEDSGDSVDMWHNREAAEYKPGASGAATDREGLTSELGRLPVKARPLRKGPIVRLLDAFGREASQDEVVGKHEEGSSAAAGSSRGQRNRSTIRMVDAMGREIDEGFDDDEEEKRKFEDDVLMTQVRAVARLRETVAELRGDFSDAERSQNGVAVRDEDRAEELERISRSARDARDKISKSMQMVHDADPELHSRLGALKEAMRRSRLLPSAMNNGGRRLPSPWSILCFVLLQIVLIYSMYKVATFRARRIYETTYYDPFYPDLYIHALKSDALQHAAVPAQASWSVFSIPDGVARGGLGVAFSEMWGNMTIAAANFNRWTYEILGTDNQLWAWPPT